MDNLLSKLKFAKTIWNKFVFIMNIEQKFNELEQRIKILEDEIDDKKLKCPYCKSNKIKAQKQEIRFLSSFIESNSFICADCESVFKID